MHSAPLTPVRRLVSRYGGAGTSALITLFSAVSAVLITLLIKQLFSSDEAITIRMILTPITAAFIIAPVASYFSLKLLSELMKAEAQNAKIVAELQQALSTVQQLSGLLPICAYCKEIRDDDGGWQQLEQYISTHSDAIFSHGICPNCVQTEFPEFPELRQSGNSSQT